MATFERLAGMDAIRTRVALVTGGNRGLGLEVCAQLAKRGLDVFLGARDAVLGKQAADELAGRGRRVRVVSLDVADPRSIDRCLAKLEKDGVAIDILINNAGVYPPGTVMTATDDAFRETMEVHYHGPVRLCRALIPQMRKRKYGRIVNVSSGSGSFGEGLEGPAAYCISKAAMNAFTFKLAEVAGPHVKVNTLCPGWVRTRMGGPRASRGVVKGAETIVWLATLPENGPTGKFFRDKKEIPW
jgi:NAD(P)-dependent dehydrogenase (short-subunit alcohol dehydrogenase family)